MLRVSSIQTEKADMNSESEIKSSTTNFLGQKSIGFQFGPLNKVFFIYEYQNGINIFSIKTLIVNTNLQDIPYHTKLFTEGLQETCKFVNENYSLRVCSVYNVLRYLGNTVKGKHQSAAEAEICDLITKLNHRFNEAVE